MSRLILIKIRSLPGDVIFLFADPVRYCTCIFLTIWTVINGDKRSLLPFLSGRIKRIFSCVLNTQILKVWQICASSLEMISSRNCFPITKVKRFQTLFLIYKLMGNGAFPNSCLPPTLLERNVIFIIIHLASVFQWWH